jgi:hypothetical protein
MPAGNPTLRSTSRDRSISTAGGFSGAATELIEIFARPLGIVYFTIAVTGFAPGVSLVLAQGA